MLYPFLFVLGTAIGSFLNVLIDRWSTGESVMGRSYCDHCHHKLAWSDLLPIISYFLLAGKCRYCHKKVSFYYPLVEFITGSLFVITALIVLMPSYSSTVKESLIINPFMGASLLPFSNLIGIIVVLGLVSCMIVIFFAYALVYVVLFSLSRAIGVANTG